MTGVYQWFILDLIERGGEGNGDHALLAIVTLTRTEPLGYSSETRGKRLNSRP